METPVILATGSRGFTLLELLIVLAIVVLLAAAWPFATGRLFPAQQLRNESQQFISLTRSARMRSRLSGAPSVVVFAPNGGQYQVGSEIHRLPLGVFAHLRDREVATRDPALTFYPDGSSIGGIVDFTTGQRQLAVSIGPLLGRAVVIE